MSHQPIALALDFGTTRCKLGVLLADGTLQVALAEPAPKLRGEGLIREGDPQTFLATANSLIERAAKRWP